MTKKEMIRAIQVAEAKAWQQLSRDKRALGINSDNTNLSRSEWGALYDLRKSLGLPGLGVADMIAEGVLPL